MSQMSEPQRWSVGRLLLPARTATLPLSRARLHAYLQCLHGLALGLQYALAHARDFRPFLLGLSCASRRIARALGVHGRTGYGWCWWLRHAALSDESGRQVDRTVEADDLSHTTGHKGQAKQGGATSLGRQPWGRRKKREPGRRHDDKDRPTIIAWTAAREASSSRHWCRLMSDPRERFAGRP